MCKKKEKKRKNKRQKNMTIIKNFYADSFVKRH